MSEALSFNHPLIKSIRAAYKTAQAEGYEPIEIEFSRSDYADAVNLEVALGWTQHFPLTASHTEAIKEGQATGVRGWQSRTGTAYFFAAPDR